MRYNAFSKRLDFVSRIFFSFTTWLILVNVIFYVVLWLFAWQAGTIPSAADFYGNHGPWRRACFFSTVDTSEQEYAFCLLSRLLPLFFFSIGPLFAAALTGLIMKPARRSILLLVISAALGYVALEHMVLID